MSDRVDYENQREGSLPDWIKTPIDTIYLDTLPRLLRSELTVRSFGVKPHSVERLDDTFHRYGFAFIVDGGGTLYEDNRKWQVKAPAILHHRPGRHYTHIPDPWWDEFYITFPESARTLMESPPWNMLDTPVIPLRDGRFMLRHFGVLFTLFKKISGFGMPDRFDLAAAELLLEVISLARVDLRCDHDLLGRLQHYLEAHYLEKIDYRDLAAKFGVSPRHLRRIWTARHGMAPTQYVLQLQMQQAKYLLDNTDMRIGEIAAMLNLDDALYFSRKFAQHAGMSPSVYRNRFKQ